MLRPDAWNGLGGRHRAHVLRKSMLLRKEGVEMKPEIDFDPLRETGSGQLPAR
ncbi:hypothetical protein [Dankookia rubra]|uniref:hypothetical protein n=1 Tax=Dankookia rubra TaxID=1442381 RepID=UPI00140B9B92|nr:hypothetical protein [Dankookia rubra]